jgi:chromosome segregation ATPase
MDHPTNEQFEELKRRVERLEQRTELIKVTRIEIDTGEVRERFDRIEQKQADHSERFDILDRRQQELKQELYAVSHTWLESLQENVDEIKAEILTAQATQNERFDRIGMTMATKADMAAMETRMERIELAQAGQGAKLDQILALLQAK